MKFDGWKGNKNQRHFEAKKYKSATPKPLSAIYAIPGGKKPEDEPGTGKCEKCKRPVRRSWRTDILWTHCFTCRYLMMIYGPSIEVKYVPARK